MAHTPTWLAWVQQVQALAQSGLAYCTNPFDIERYQALRQLAADMLATCTQTDVPTVRGLFESQSGYATPKVDVRGAVFQDNRLLLVRERSDGGWTLPGGWADVNEAPSQAVEKEVLQESGFQVRASKVLAVYDRSLHGHPPYIFHSYKLFFRCDLLGGSPTDSIETSGAAFYSMDEIPPLSLLRVTPEEIDRMFHHHHHPDLPTDFD
jgi:ADP-ribose pyrophosphatase YjhB (NUDIX family)